MTPATEALRVLQRAADGSADGIRAVEHEFEATIYADGWRFDFQKHQRNDDDLTHLFGCVLPDGTRVDSRLWEFDVMEALSEGERAALWRLVRP